MKIKTATKMTGLSDRTIRYYIEEKLIFPSFSENYLGRKSFDFSPQNIEDLKNIAVLRKFDFTIEEIRQIITDVEKSKAIIRNVKIRNEQTLEQEQIRQHVLSQIQDNKVYTVAELAQKLSTASVNLPKAEEKIKRDIAKTILSGIKATLIFLVVWLPVAFQLLFFVTTLLIYAYPKFYNATLIYMVLSVLPSVLLILLNKIKKDWKKVVRKRLLVLCMVSLLCACVVFGLPVGTMAKSETTNFMQYRDVDADCLANRDLFFQELFPVWPHYFEDVKQADGSYKTVYLDAHYYYRYLSFMDYTYDIYAEWPLDAEAFKREVARVAVLFETYAADEEWDLTYLIMEKGDYTCLVFYDGDPVFEEATDNYSYYLFAYDRTNLKVRYLYCHSLENGADQPYYLSLDW